jgi:ribosomal protein RSM22 (predicted rRNA methylase)
MTCVDVHQGPAFGALAQQQQKPVLMHILALEQSIQLRLMLSVRLL